MKKFYVIAAMAAVTMSLVSCQEKPGTEDGPQGGDYPTIERTVRLKQMDDYVYSYDAQGRVASIVTENDNRVFTYEGNKLTIKNNGTIEYTCTLNSDGFATQVKDAEHTIDITYDEHGYLISSKFDGEERSKNTTTQSIEDGNIMYWTRYDAENDFLRRKEATYLDNKKNLGCVNTHWAEDLKLKRWMWEARLLGNTSVDVMESCVWCNFGDEYAAKTAVYEYEYDANGVITKETKYYGPWNGNNLDGMDFDDEHTFVWEPIK